MSKDCKVLRHNVVFIKRLVYFFLNQKTAYEIRPRDWSSDVCSSDLDDALRDRRHPPASRRRPQIPGAVLSAMKFSYNWLREFVPGLTQAAAPLEELITIKTAECEGIEQAGALLANASIEIGRE